MSQGYDEREVEVFYQDPDEEGPLNPWFSIWTKPRATMRQIIDTDPERLVIILAMLGGMGEALSRASNRNLGDQMPLGGVIALAVIGGSIGGVIGLYLGGAILRWTGSWLGGTGTSVTVRAALAWGQVPVIWSILLWIPLFLLYAEEMFQSATPRIDANPFPLFGIAFLDIVISIWSVVVWLKCLGEAHEFSAWRALGAGLLCGLVFAGIALAIALPFILIVLLGNS